MASKTGGSEMSDPTQPTDPAASAPLTDAPMPVVPPGKSCKGRRVTHEEHEAMFQAWKGGMRNQADLARRFHVTDDTIRKYVNRGIDANGWIAWKERLRTEQRISAETQTRIADNIAKDITDAYGKVKEESLVILRQFRLVCTHQVVKLQKTLETMPMTRQAVHYSVNDKGEPVRKTVERPLDAVETAGVARALSGAITAANKMESLWLGGPTERIDNVPESEKLSEAEVAYVSAHEGELPPGMTIEQYLMKMARVFDMHLVAGKQSN